MHENQLVLFLPVHIAFTSVSPLYIAATLIFQNRHKHIMEMRSPGQVTGGVLELTCSNIQAIYYETNHCEVIAGLTLNKLKLKEDIACQLCNSLISLQANP